MGLIVLFAYTGYEIGQFLLKVSEGYLHPHSGWITDINTLSVEFIHDRMSYKVPDKCDVWNALIQMPTLPIQQIYGLMFITKLTVSFSW